MRDKATIKRLKMYKGGKPVRYKVIIYLVLHNGFILVPMDDFYVKFQIESLDLQTNSSEQFIVCSMNIILIFIYFGHDRSKVYHT